MQVAAANVLMVGAGGIGCELVKTLVLSGFRKITMVRPCARVPLFLSCSAHFATCQQGSRLLSSPHSCSL